ncbi:MAG: phosphoenolpyruvate synthase/pyruvate phosphate dikinase, partial [Flavobacteriaceae bacterium]
MIAEVYFVMYNKYMKYTRNFKELTKDDAHIAGGKGASLGEMLNNNIPVPDGYVVTADTFDQFLAETDLTQELQAILTTVDTKAIHTVEHASDQIQTLIKSVQMPEDIAIEVMAQFKDLNAEYVAVRSSATAEDGADHAWAGQLDSYLNTTEENLLEMVQSCWASLFTPRAIFYRYEKGLHTTHISVAVVVQKMVNSEKSGIAFSVHPVTEDYNQIIIEAGLGLGEAIVSGSVTPDSYVITKEPQEIIDVHVNTQYKALYRSDTLDIEHGFNEWKDLSDSEANEQVLTKEQILELSNIIVTIENHYGFPCDIEWAFENDTFYIVQSRPITTLKPISKEPKITFEKAYTRDTSMIIQQGWNACVTNPYYSSETNPHTPPVIHYMNDGVIEIWENEKATQWILDSLQNFIKTDEQELISLIDQYENDLEDMKVIWENGPITSASEFESFVEKVFKAMKGFDTMYFPSVDERTPEHIRERTLRLRDEDVYFDTCDKLIRDSLIAIYPELKGYESAILKSEINNPPSKEILAKRKENFVVIGQEFAEQITLREYLSQHPEYKFYIETPPTDSSTLVGQVGNKGYAKGVVRVMKRKDQIDEAKEGDIIVSTMTTPDFMPAMNKAAAIITDEGGVTCHAAIVARELGKPCVIGARFATEILNDGDLVEVDADNGIVKILESKNIDLNYFNNLAFQASRPQNLQRDEMIAAMYKIFELDSRFVTIPFEGRQRGLYIDQASEDEMYSRLLKKVDTNQKFNEFLIKYSELENKFDHDIKKYSKEQLPKKELSELLINFNQNLIDFGEHAWIPYPIEKYLDNIFLAELKISNPKNYQEIYEAVSNITELTDYHKMRLEICEAVISKKDFKEVAKHLTELYYWSSEYSLIEPFLDEDHFNVELRKLNFSDAKEEKHKILEIETLNKELFEKAIDKIKDQKILLHAKVINKYVFLRSDRVDVFRRIVAPARILLNQVAVLLYEETKLSWEYLDMVNLSNQEIQGYLLDGIIPELDFVRKRAENYIFVFDKNGTRMIDQLEQVKNISEYIKNQGDKSDQIKGKVAYKGKVTGKVSLVFSKEDLTKVQAGDILVARTTMVDYTPVMEISSAFVTAEGGITSHAAIVSRELKKPCIVGTGNCMDLLKDGDLVEVDADNGIVKILKKTKSSGSELISKIKDLNWFKSWEAKSPLFLPTMGGPGYFKCIKEEFGFSLDHFLVTTKKGLLSGYWVEDEMKAFGNHVANLAVKNPELLSTWSERLKLETDICRELVSKDVNYFLDINNYQKLRQADEMLTAYQITVRDVVNYLPDNLREEYMSDLEGARKYSETIFFELATIVGKVMNHISKQEKYSRDVLDCLTADELEIYITDKKLPTEEVLQERYNSSGYINHPEFTWLNENEVKEIEQSFLSHSSHILKGQTAYEGKVTGIVRIIKDFSQSEDFIEGEILVTGMTDPNYVPIMKKAAAIVTDAGGLLCHAAIVSREMKVPCVVGTKIGTQILNDGDLVEVDADNGIVRILEKGQNDNYLLKERDEY